MLDIKIIAQTEDYVVINKPAGLLVHATNKKGFDEKTLVDFLLEKFPAVKNVGDDPDVRPGIVHRLDRNVSGVMVVPLNQDMFNHLKKKFQKREVKKEYIALVHGDVQKVEGEINFSIKRKTTGGRMAARPDEEGKEAITRFVVLEKKKKYSLLKINIDTGRTNQIRVHMNAYGHPVVGDFVYRPKKLKPRKGEKELERAFLYCKKLGFKDINGDFREFETELPAKLDLYLKNL